MELFWQKIKTKLPELKAIVMYRIVVACRRLSLPAQLFERFIEISAAAKPAVMKRKLCTKMEEEEVEKRWRLPGQVRESPMLFKIDNPEFQNILSPELKTLVGIFKKYNHEVRIAGGAVRDILMEIHPKDVDLATTATPDQMKLMFDLEHVRMINAKGEKHGTITPRINDKENFEVTTLRVDIRTDGRHADVEFTTDWRLDASRRDLTINSMYLDFDGQLYDYFYGYDDLKDRRILFVGDPNMRLKEDYLRILRYFRFYGRIAQKPNDHNEATMQAISNNVVGLARISGERIWSELQKIVSGNYAYELMVQLIRCGACAYIGLPLDPNLEEFERVCRLLEQLPGKHSPILWITALLNAHEDAVFLHDRLKLSAYERDLALFITHQRDNVDDIYWSALDYKKLCLQPQIKREFVLELLKYSGKLDIFKELNAWQIPKFPLNGNILLAHGCPEDKRLSSIISQLKIIWADQGFTLSGDDLIDLYLPEILNKSNSPVASPPRKRHQ